jgi:hypothetical protein
MKGRQQTMHLKKLSPGHNVTARHHENTETGMYQVLLYKLTK